MIGFTNQSLSAWQTFYVIVGPASAELIGIQFVVITLIVNMRRPVPADAMRAYATPTVVHLTTTLLLSAIMTAPWPTLFPASLALIACGLAGLAYSVATIRRARRQTYYAPDCGDQFWYAFSPCGVYIALLGTAFFLNTECESSMILIGGETLALLLIGIHNAWDTVTHIVSTQGADMPSRSTSGEL